MHVKDDALKLMIPNTLKKKSDGTDEESEMDNITD